METFGGILIATTNFVEHLDNAISRRFHFKLEFNTPDQACRLKLWRLHLPPSIPGASEIDLERLAKCYALTGGQIRIIVENACAQAALRGIKSKVTTAVIMQYADMETEGSFEPSARLVGFRSNSA